ncbi:MAG: CBS domain-containing protein [Candidatus Kariarchaeaceae archaeon]|jgi:magnesium transporter
MIVDEVEIEDDYITVKETDSILEVAKAIAKAGIPDAVVVDNDNHALGALDDYDIVSKVIAMEKDPNELTAKDIMYAPPPVRKSTTLKETHEIMQQLEATMLPVVDEEKKLIGVVTIMDVLEGIAFENRPPSIISRVTGLFRSNKEE